MRFEIDRIKGPIFDLFDFFMGKTPIEFVIISFFSVAVIIFMAFPVHECSHALAAKILGDDTAERQGRLTLNPLVHIDPYGALMMCIVCIGWAKPVPVNINRCRKVNSKAALAITSFAGPLSNVVLSYIFMIIFKIITNFVTSMVMFYVLEAVYLVITINTYLAVFNLLPIPPFDGFKIFAAILPAKVVYNMERYQQFISLGFLLLLIGGILDIPLGYASTGIIWLLDKASFFVPMYGI